MARQLLVPLLATAALALACGQDGTAAEKSPLCAADYQPAELTVTRVNPAGTDPGPDPASGTSTDAEAIRKVARAACSLPSPPADLMCTAEIGPTFELRFTDTGGRSTVLQAEAYSCGFVTGLDVRRYSPAPLWQSLTDARLPSASPR